MIKIISFFLCFFPIYLFFGVITAIKTLNTIVVYGSHSQYLLNDRSFYFLLSVFSLVDLIILVGFVYIFFIILFPKKS